MENEHNRVKGSSRRSPEELFNKFVEAEDCPEILQSFQRLVHAAGIEKTETSREFYQNLKSKLQSWKCKSLWELLDNRANQKEYSKGTICEDIHALVIGCGPVGLRTAIELALLGAQVVIVEKRQTFSRNNVLHLWPFLLTDFRSLGAKKFYGKFCSGSIDHVSIRRLQAILLKTALILGVKVFTGVTFEKVIEPISEEEGWKCSVTPSDHSVSDFELDVLIGADGKKNVLPGFAQIEMRGTLAIGVTANFVNYYSEEEARVEEISGIAYQFNPGFFQKLRQLTGISLENIVYYKDETHYFVMTALKSSLLERGVLKEDFGNNPKKLLSPHNINQANLTSYVNDTVEYATKGQLKHRDLKKDKKGNADIAVFDFTSIKKAENSARIKERKGHKLLIGLVGDSLLEPFWPTGSGCARGVLSALDAAWMVRSFAQDKPPLQILSERENIYRLLSGTSSQNLQKNFDLYTINPSSRYMHIPQKKIQEVYHLYDTDDPVNADFSLGSPTGILQTKGTKKKRVSLGTSIKQRRKNRKHIKFAVQSSHDSQNCSPLSSSTEDLSMRREDKVKFAEPMPKSRARTASETLTSGGEEVHEITKNSKKVKKSRKSRSPLSSSQEKQSKMKKSPFDTSSKKKSKKRKQDRVTPPSGAAHEEKTTKRRSFFGFGRGKNKSRLGRKSPKTSDVSKENKAINETVTAAKATKVETSNGGFTPLGEPSWDKEETNYNFSRDNPTRRSAREIIAEMEARSRQIDDISAREKKPANVPRMKIVHLPVTGGSNNGEIKASAKRATSEPDTRTPQSKLPRKEDLWQELSSMSPSAKAAVPALSKMSSEKPKNHRHELSHDIESAMRMTGLMAIATPLLLDEPTQKSVLYSERSWFSRNNGHVKSAISKYDSLTGKTLLAKNNDSTPLRAPIDMVDGPNNRSERKPTLVEIANQKTTSGEEQVDHVSSIEVDQGPSSWQPTAIAFVEGKTEPSEMERAANERAMDYARQEQMEKLQLLKNDFASLDQESTDSPVKKDLSSPIYQKTFLASVKKTPEAKDMANSPKNDHKHLETPRDYAKEAEWRKSPALAKKEMERLMVSLTETMSKERAEASIRFLISMFRRIQRNPKEEKFRRIFKSRVKFKKYVWTVRNAKMFMFASGWIEVGSFLIFSANKNVREPLAILNRHLGLLAAGSSVQISAIKSTPRRDLESRTPRSARALPFSIETPKTPKATKTPSSPKTPSLSKTPSTSRTPGSNTDGKPNLPESLPRPNSTHNEKTPTKKGLMRTGSQNTPLDKRFSKSVPLDLDSNWDLEMEDPLTEESLSKNEVKRGRLTSSALDVRERSYSKGKTPLGRTPTRPPVTPEIAIMEEIEGLSNTLDDLMESMEDEKHDESDGKKARPKEEDRPGQELNDLCTTVDYMLDSSEEEEFDRDLGQWNKELLKVGSPGRSASAFSKVPLRSSMSEKVSSTQGNIEEEISTMPKSLLSVKLDETTVQKTKKITSKTSDEKEEIPTRKSDNIRKPVSAPAVNTNLKVNLQQKKKISSNIKDRKNDIGSNKSDTVPKDVTSSVKVQNAKQYSLRPRVKKPMSSSDKDAESSSKLRDSKRITKRKLPAEPDKRPVSLSDVHIQKRLSSSSLSSFNPPKKERPSSRNSVNSEKDAQDSKFKIKRKTSLDSNISSSKSDKSGDIRKDRPFAINKIKSKSVTSLNDSTIESKRRAVHVDSKAGNKFSSVSKSKSEMSISAKLNTNATSTNIEKKKSASVSTSRKETSSSSSETKLPTNQTDQKRRSITRNSKQDEGVDKKPVLSKSQGLNTGNEFKKPDLPKPRRRPESSKTAGKPRESTGGENLSTSSLNTSLKNRPPTGLERTRSARARRRQEIAAKLESLETSLESLENSPNRTLTKRTSISSLESSACSTRKSSLTETVNEHLRSSLSKKTSASRTSSAASRSNVASGENVQDNSNKTKRSTSKDSGTRRRSSAKRTPSNASLERKKLDGLLSKEEQELIRRRSSARATKNNPEMIRHLRSKAVDISQIRRADSSESGNLRRSGSFKAKNRRAAARVSSKNQDDIKPSSCNAEQDLKKTEAKESPEKLEQKVTSADDSFDGITVVGVDTTDFVSSNTDSQGLVLEDNKPSYHGKDEQEIAGERNFEEQSSCGSAKDDLKMEFRLQNTGSWMVLDYEVLGESPRAPKKINLSSKNYHADQSPRSSISSIETPKQEETESNEDFVMRLQVGAGDENASNHSKENGKVSVEEDDIQDELVCNGAVVSEKDSGSINGVNNERPGLHAQNGSVNPYANGIAPRETSGEIPRNDPIKKGAFKKKVKDDKTKTTRNSQSVDTLTSEKSRVTFEEIQNLNVPRASTQNRSPKDTKKHVNFPFTLRKKKSESFSELNSSTPEISIESPSPAKSKTIAPRGLIISPEDKSHSSPHDKSNEKKKLAPFKMFKKRKSQDAGT